MLDPVVPDNHLPPPTAAFDPGGDAIVIDDDALAWGADTASALAPQPGGAEKVSIVHGDADEGDADHVQQVPCSGVPSGAQELPVTLKRHPLSALFEPYDLVGQDFQDLVASIRQGKVYHPIVARGDEILDGWVRYQASLVAGVEPVVVELEAVIDPWEFVLAANIYRRHLTPVQRVAILAAKEELDRKEAGPGAVRSKWNTPSVRQLAKELCVGVGTAQRAATVLRAGDPEINQAIANGDISLEEAADVAKLPAQERPAALIRLQNPMPVGAKPKREGPFASAGRQVASMTEPDPQPPADDREAEIQQLRATIKEKQTRIEELVAEIARLKQANAWLEEDNAWLEGKNDRLEAENAWLEEEIARLQPEAKLRARETVVQEDTACLVNVVDSTATGSKIHPRETVEPCSIIPFQPMGSPEVPGE